MSALDVQLAHEDIKTKEQIDAEWRAVQAFDHKLWLAKLAMICDHFKCLPSDPNLARLTEVQIDKVLFHARNKKTGEIKWPRYRTEIGAPGSAGGGAVGDGIGDEQEPAARRQEPEIEIPADIQKAVRKDEDGNITYNAAAINTLKREKNALMTARFNPFIVDFYAEPAQDGGPGTNYDMQLRQLEAKYAKLALERGCPIDKVVITEAEADKARLESIYARVLERNKSMGL